MNAPYNTGATLRKTMEQLKYKSVERINGRFPQWLNDLRNSSGAYVIRSKRTGQCLYVGESHTGRLATTIKRHFWDWNDHSDRKHFVFSVSAVEVAVRVTPPPAAKGAQNNLIRRLLPIHNSQAIPADEQERRDDPLPF